MLSAAVVISTLRVNNHCITSDTGNILFIWYDDRQMHNKQNNKLGGKKDNKNKTRKLLSTGEKSLKIYYTQI